MIKLLLVFFLSFSISLFGNEDLKSCVETKVSKTSVIFTCMHGEYYIKYESTSRRDVEELKVLYTKAHKFKYLNQNQYNTVIKDK